MKAITPRPIYLKDYRRPDFDVPDIHLRFEIFDEKVMVTAVMTLKARGEAGQTVPALVLDGENFRLHSLKLDGKLLSPDQYTVTSEQLQISKVPREFTLEVQNEIWP